MVESCSGVSWKACCEQQNRRGKPRVVRWCKCVMVFGGAGERRGFAGAVWAPGSSQRFRSHVVLFTAPLKGAGTCTGPGPDQEDLSTVLQPQRRAAAGWGREGKGRKGKGRRARQLRAAEKVFHGSYLQPSKELQRLPIKTLLKHFWCCQQWRAEIAQWSLRYYLPQAVQWYCQ